MRVLANKIDLKRKIDRTRRDIGRIIHIYTPLKIACTICTSGGFYDSYTDKSVYVKCPECKGSFWKNELKDHEVLARVHWTTDEAINITPGGKYFTGDAYAHVDPEYHTLAQQAQEPGGKVVIDGQDMTITKIMPQGAPEINRYRLILISNGQRPK